MLNAFDALVVVVVNIHPVRVVVIILVNIVIEFDNVILVPALLRRRERFDGI
jgi:hypothetical protein